MPLPLLALSLPLALAQDAGFTVSARGADAGVLHYRWIPDLAVTGVSLGTFAWLYTHGPLDPGGAAEPIGIDRVEVPRWNPRAAAASDFFGHAAKYYGVNIPVLSALGMGVYGGLRQDSVGAGAIWTLTMVECVSVDLVVTEALKVGFSRPRPYTALAFRETWPDAWASETIQHDLSEDGHYDAYKSFPSGHTSSAGAASFAAATLLWQDLSSRGARPWVAGLTYGAATAITATTGTLRVVAGYHHPTDVIAGGLLGAGIGFGTARLHTLTPRDGAVQASLGADAEGVPMLRLGGVW